MIIAYILLTFIIGASALLGWVCRASKQWFIPLIVSLLIVAGSIGLFSRLIEENSGIGYLKTEYFLKTNTLYMTSFIGQSHERFIAELYDEDGRVFFYTLSFQPPTMFVVKKNGNTFAIEEMLPPYTGEQMEKLKRFRENNFPQQKKSLA